MALDELEELDVLEELDEFAGGGISGVLPPELPQPIISKKLHSSAGRASELNGVNIRGTSLLIIAERLTQSRSQTLNGLIVD